MRKLYPAALTLALCFAAPFAALGQENEVEPPDPSNGARLRVFLDCQSDCDFNYLRRELTYLAWVRDRLDAQVHVIVTERDSGAGEEIRLQYVGREEFTGLDDEFAFSNSDTDTDDERRERFARYLAHGLGRYLARTPQGEQVAIAAVEGAEAQAAAPAAEDDPWNYWVFRIRGSTEVEAEDRQDDLAVEGSVTASRTTEDLKIQIGFDGEYEDSTFEFDDGDTLTDISREVGFGAQFVRSVGEYWGVGFGVAAAASTFSNLNLSPRVAVAVERNLFPYAESSQHEMTFTYFLGITRFDYREETLFEKTEEVAADHGVIASYDITRPWGDAGFDVEFSQFLDDLKKLRLEVRGSIDYRILRGLSVFVRGNVGLVRDQRFLPLRGATEEEVLLRRRALATDAEWGIDVGFSFTFGSIYNNVVNTRFSGASGGFHRVPYARGGGNGGG